ncbi:MAG: hypothetical protein M1817_001236 [Caeruleum heppii]|nr:MAG: hypothetical protein M1817_001236 [Caeruleum heppii]
MAKPSPPSTSRKASSRLSKLYHHASSLYLTRRFEEALSALEPIITPDQPIDTPTDGTHDTVSSSAPIVQASASARIKIWCLYLTLLNALVELGPEEGKHVLGIKRWRSLVARVRDGRIWEDVVKNGYRELEGDVDAEVVVNLATLVLAHSEDQKVTQQRLESYLSTAPPPSLDISSSLASIASPPSSPPQESQSVAETTTTTSNAHTFDHPSKALASRLKIIELYALHVLPRNDEYDLAESFISASDLLDDERRESFVHALQTMKTVKERTVDEAEQGRRETARKVSDQMVTQRGNETERKTWPETLEPSKPNGKHATVSEETDYGIASNPNPAPMSSSTNNNNHPQTPAPRKTPNSPPSRLKKTLPPAKATKRTSLTTVQSLLNMLHSIPSLISSLLASLTKNPTILVRTLCFLVAFLMVWGSRDVRDRTQAALKSAWRSVKGTVAMGGKVSYI